MSLASRARGTTRPHSGAGRLYFVPRSASDGGASTVPEGVTRDPDRAVAMLADAAINEVNNPLSYVIGNLEYLAETTIVFDLVH